MSDESSPTGPRRHHDWWYGWSGLVGAILFGVSSFTPSLLPRTPVLQGLIAGIAAAFGYGIGETVAWLAGRLVRWHPGPTARRRSWWVLAVAGSLGVVVGLVAGWRWQRQIHELMGQAAPGALSPFVVLALGLLVFAGLVAVSRFLRRVGGWVLRQVLRFVPLWLARTVAVVAVALLVVGVISGVVMNTFLAVSNAAFSVRDTATTEGVVRPTSPERSGSPDSAVRWESVGREGRDFLGTGPTREQISAFSGTAAQDPIRVYAGLQTAPDVQDRVAAVVDELRRTHAFDRKALVVVTTTGTGWVDPASVDALEYMWGGDTAIAAMQYSYLPSWISFLADKSKAQEAGVALFRGVHDAWSALPADHRPELYAFGESLGSFGGHEAFASLDEMAAQTSGAVYAGTPNFTALWQSLVAARDEGSLERLPVYQDGRVARWMAAPGDVERLPGPWSGSRVVYLQYASDPIVWWSGDLVGHEPDWLREPRGADVLPEMRWIPWVTFWQVTADMVFSTAVPPGHGHKYLQDYVDAWVAAGRPAGWTAADTAQLRDLLAR
ncbi:MAG TPA: alpha/beta-hydrolase family protein [Candidatus Nanopelagicales bacterium]|nr:alpha/beta-hydrolase family protein [Candidatus Nanopelagicales bacterium]